MKTSAPASASSAVPRSPRGFVNSAKADFTGVSPGRPAWTTPSRSHPTTSVAPAASNIFATATPAGPGGIQASLSPFADPPDSTASAPDTDYYKMIGKGGGTVTVSVGSTNTVDPVIEILDANGQRYKTCKDPGDDNPTLTFIVRDTTPDAFDDECLNDDIDPTVNRSAQLQFQVPGAAGTLTTFYVHVFDSAGNARPDMTYSMYTSGDAIWPMYLPQVALSAAKVSASYTDRVSVSYGGSATVTYQLVGGALPPGLTFGGNGSITGTPTTAGTYTFTVQATSSDNPAQVATQTYGITVNP